MAAAVVLVWPEIAAAAAEAAAWAARIYRVYKVAKTVEAVTAAQGAEEVDSAANENAKTDAQVKADAAASADCKDCEEDPKCAKPKKSLNSHLGSDSVRNAVKSGAKNFFQLVCEQMHGAYGPGSLEYQKHLDTLKEKQKQIRERLDQLKRWKCTIDPEIENRANAAESANIDNLPYKPMNDFLAHCQGIGTQGKLPTGTH